MRLATALLVLIALPSIALSQNYSVHVHPQNRVFNKTGIQCGWATLETLGRHHGYPQLHTMTEKHLGLSSVFSLQRELVRQGVPYRAFYRPITRSLTPIERALQKGHPVGVMVSPNGRFRIGHFYVVSGIDRDKGTVTIVDNHGDMRPKQIPIRAFRRIYTGVGFYLR